MARSTGNSTTQYKRLEPADIVSTCMLYRTVVVGPCSPTEAARVPGSMYDVILFRALPVRAAVAEIYIGYPVQHDTDIAFDSISVCPALCSTGPCLVPVRAQSVHRH